MKHKILIYSSAYPPTIHGAATVVRNMAQSLAAKDLSVTVVTPGLRNSTEDDAGVLVKHFKAFTTNKLLIFIILTITGLRCSLKEKFDLIHAHGTVGGLAAFITNVIMGTPYIMTFHRDDLYLSSIRNSKELTLRLVNLIVARRARYVHVPHLELAKRTSQVLKIKYSKLAIIPYPVPIRFFLNDIEEFNKKTVNILSCGLLIRRKRYDLLLLAFASLVAKHPEVRLIIAGEGNQRRYLQSLSDSLGISKSVNFLGEIDESELIKQYHSCMAYVSASDSELFGMTIAEAMAAGKPIISTRTIGATFLIEDNVNGLLVDIGDAGELASCLEKVITNPDLAREMGRASRRKAENDLSPDVFANKYTKVFLT
jgi:Glycosyltransferase